LSIYTYLNCYDGKHIDTKRHCPFVRGDRYDKVVRTTQSGKGQFTLTGLQKSRGIKFNQKAHPKKAGKKKNDK